MAAPRPQAAVRDESRPNWPIEFADDVAYLRTGIVNVFFVGPAGAGDRKWVLIDAGLPGYAQSIASAAAERFGADSRPSAIILTHGHFDHVGTVQTLAEMWDAPVYAHDLERPYITGRSPYPPPDPTVGGGLIASLCWVFPRGPIDLDGRVHPLPSDASVPGMPGWRWIHTPGHSPGHVSFFRDEDRTLIAGDAFVTTKQESALAVFTQRPEIHGPPAYYTQDWKAARDSVEELAALEPAVAGTGHGVPLGGERLRVGLSSLTFHFRERALPPYGRYVVRPAVFGPDGVISVPPDVPHPLLRGLAAFGIGFVVGKALQTSLRHRA